MIPLVVTTEPLKEPFVRLERFRSEYPGEEGVRLTVCTETGYVICNMKIFCINGYTVEDFVKSICELLEKAVLTSPQSIANTVAIFVEDHCIRDRTGHIDLTYGFRWNWLDVK